jgi:mannose-6-phosphate isomerase-like protein (cupin superfamily)
MTPATTPAPVPAFLPDGSFARYDSLDWDRGAYSDVSAEGRRRKIIRMISRAPDAPVRVKHNFQIGSIDSSAGNGPTLHAHDYPEVFIPIRSAYFVDYGDKGRHRARLGTYDAFSLPLNVLRKFEAVEVAPRESQMLSLFDTTLEDARKGIKITPEIAAADAAAGLQQDFDVSTDLVDFSPEQAEAEHIARFADLKVEDTGGLLLRRLIASGDSRAALRTPHNVQVDFIEVPAGKLSDAYRSECREVFVALEGQAQVLWNDKAVAMQRLDVFSVAPDAQRAIGAAGSSRALLLRIRDLTNAA